MGIMSDYQNMQAKIQKLADRVLAERKQRLAALYSQAQADAEDVRVKPGAAYTKVDLGDHGHWHGKLMVEHATGNVYGIKAYGKVHKGHQYGTLETIDDFYWGDYYPSKKEA